MRKKTGKKRNSSVFLEALIIFISLISAAAAYFLYKAGLYSFAGTVLLCSLLFLTAAFILLFVFFYHKAKETVVLFNPSSHELDKLENDVLLMPDTTRLFVFLGDWILDKINCAFVAFVFVTEKHTFSVQYYQEKVESFSDLKQMLKERLSEIMSPVIKMHSCGGVTVPYYKYGVIEGYFFIGRKIDGDYTEAELSRFVPLARIFGKTMLFMDAKKFQKEKNQLQSAFSRYVSPDVVDEIVNNPDVIHLGGEKQCLSVIFTDLEGFTSLSDSMDPVMLVRVLNLYLNEMSEVIIALGGTIDKFEGDAIMAFFGAPTPIKDHAVRCCRAALRMQKMESIINEQLLSEKLITKPLHTRIGINSGDMVVGNVGSLKRLDYTIIGGNVNIAARIENENKRFGTSILISDQTYEMVKDHFKVRMVDEVKLRGVSRSVVVYELLDEVNCETSPDNFSIADYVSVQDELEELEELDEA